MLRHCHCARVPRLSIPSPYVSQKAAVLRIPPAERPTVKNVPVLMVLILMWLASSGVAHAQSFELYGSAGPILTEPGNSFAAGAGFSPTSRITAVFTFERTYIASQSGRDGGVYWDRPGGTLYLGTAELRFAPFGRGRVGPFALAGIAAGVSRLNVNVDEVFGESVINSVRTMFVGRRHRSAA